MDSQGGVNGEVRMTTDWRPMNLGEILDRTFEIYRKNVLVFVGIAAFPALAMLSIHLIDITWFHLRSLMNTEWAPGAVIWNLAVAIIFYHISSFFGVLFQPAHTIVASNTVLGDQISFKASLRFAASRWRSYLWLAALKLAVELFVPEALAFGLIAAYSIYLDVTGIEGPAGLPGLLVFLVPGSFGVALFLWAGARFALTIPVAALEKMAGFKALRRSWSMSRGSRLRIVFIWCALFVLGMILALSFQYFLRWIASALYAATQARFGGQHFYLEAAYVLNALIATLLGPLFPISITLIYYDQRVRKEGYDLEKMMESAGLEVPPPAMGVEDAVEAQVGAGKASSRWSRVPRHNWD